jgi:hypothetical protein
MANRARRRHPQAASDLESLTLTQLATRLEEVQEKLAGYEELKAEETAIANLLRRRIPGTTLPTAASAPRSGRSRGAHDWEAIKGALPGKLQKGVEYSSGQLRELAGVAESAGQSFYKQVVVPLYEAGTIRWNQQARRASRYFV